MFYNICSFYIIMMIFHIPLVLKIELSAGFILYSCWKKYVNTAKHYYQDINQQNYLVFLGRQWNSPDQAW